MFLFNGGRVHSARSTDLVPECGGGESTARTGLLLDFLAWIPCKPPSTRLLETSLSYTIVNGFRCPGFSEIEILQIQCPPRNCDAITHPSKLPCCSQMTRILSNSETLGGPWSHGIPKNGPRPRGNKGQSPLLRHASAHRAGGQIDQCLRSQPALAWRLIRAFFLALLSLLASDK